MKSVFSRLEDYKTKSRKEILLFAVLFFAATRIVSMLAFIFVGRLYFLYGFDAMSALRFDGSIEGVAYKAMENGVWQTLLMLLAVAPLLEECAFRLGLSFRRRDIAIGCGALVLFLASRLGCAWWLSIMLGAVGCLLVLYCSTDEFWSRLRPKWLKPAAAASAVLFGLAHLFAMHGLTLITLPYALLICLMLFFAGATFVYLRVNLGFGWALAAHILSNMPVVVMLLSMAIGN